MKSNKKKIKTSGETLKLKNKQFSPTMISKRGTLSLNLQVLQRKWDKGASINHKTVYFFFDGPEKSPSEFLIGPDDELLST